MAESRPPVPSHDGAPPEAPGAPVPGGLSDGATPVGQDDAESGRLPTLCLLLARGHRRARVRSSGPEGLPRPLRGEAGCRPRRGAARPRVVLVPPGCRGPSGVSSTGSHRITAVPAVTPHRADARRARGGAHAASAVGFRAERPPSGRPDPPGSGGGRRRGAGTRPEPNPVLGDVPADSCAPTRSREWLSGYVQTYVERDVRDVLNIGDLEAFDRFLMLMAGRTGQLLNLSSLGVRLWNLAADRAPMGLGTGGERRAAAPEASPCQLPQAPGQEPEERTSWTRAWPAFCWASDPRRPRGAPVAGVLVRDPRRERGLQGLCPPRRALALVLLA